MATQPFGEILLTVKDVVALGRSERRVLLNKEKWGARASGKGRNGKPIYLFPLDGLPSEMQTAYLAQQRSQVQPDDDIHGLDNIDPNPSVAPAPDPRLLERELRLTQALQRLPIGVREAFLNEARRLSLIVKAYLALPTRREKVTKLETGKSYYYFTQAVLDLCAQTACTDQVIIDYRRGRQHFLRKGVEPRRAKPVSPVTLDTWAKRLRREGLVIFIPQPQPSDKRKTANISPEAIQWINQHYRSKPHARALYQDLVKAARRHDWTIPSEKWIYRRWKNLPKIVTMTKKQYVDKAAPYYPRDHRSLEALQILCGDHSERDVFVRLPDGSLVRPWLTTWQCFRTGLVNGHLDLTPSSRTIGLAYAKFVRTFGGQPPANEEEGYYSYLYTDQGKDYKSHAISGKTITFKRAAAIEGGMAFLCDQRGIQALDGNNERHVGLINDLGLKKIEARGYNAREKPVERFHRDISGWEAKTFEVEYCGSDAKKKPDSFVENYARHERLVKKVQRTGNTGWLEQSPFMTFDDYREAVDGYYFEYNHDAHERSTLGGATVVPIEEYERLYTTRYTVSEQTLAMILMKADSRIPRKNGVSINGFHYLHEQLAYYHGMEVEVRHDDDFSRVYIIPPPIDTIPHPQMLEVEALVRGGVLKEHMNRRTQERVAKQRRFEANVRRDHEFLTQSMIRGETVHDRVVAEFEPAEEVVEAVAVNAGNAGRSHAPAFSGIHSSARMSGDKGLGGQMSPDSRGEANGSPHRATVHPISRFDGRVNRKAAIRPVTVDHVASVAVDESIFESEPPAVAGGPNGRGTNVVRMWEDEE